MQPPPPKRRRREDTAGVERPCPYCGRCFQRVEHLERHVRTHTKEKPFVCQCKQAFTRRDLLTRHQRLARELDGPSQPHETLSIPGQAQGHVEYAAADGEAALAAASSLSGMSAGSWSDPYQNAVSAPGYEHPQRFLNDFQVAGQDITVDDHFREFASFIDGIGLPAEWSPYFQETLVSGAAVENDVSANRKSRSGTPFSCWLPSATSEGRPAESFGDNGLQRDAPGANSLKISEDQRNRLATQLESFRDVLDPGFQLPSRHTMTRYITSYFQGFHLHMPFIHQPTWSPTEAPLEVVFAICCVGAQYCFEHRMSERLFFAGKDIALKRLNREKARFGSRTESFLHMNQCSSRGGGTAGRDLSEDLGRWEPLDTIKALVALMGYATWERKRSFVTEAFALQGLLVQALRDLGLNEDPPSGDDIETGSLHEQWIRWSRAESSRRSKLIAFTFLHIHSVSYNVYPVLRSNEIGLRLPCSTMEWKATGPVQWHDARSKIHKDQLLFQEALSSLLRHQNEGAAPLSPIPTPLANYVLLHGLLQRIHIVRDLSLPIMDRTASLPAEEVSKLESALRSWTSGWQQAPESSLDPNNENGPIPFTSSSLLGLAYVRIYLNLGPYRLLETRDVDRIAKALDQAPPVERGDGVISALLYAAHALSIPVRLGVDRVARSQAFFWSVRHSLAGLECAVLLNKWLVRVEETRASTPLNDGEDRILHWVKYIVEEAECVVDFDAAEAMERLPEGPSKLGLSVIRVWSHFFKSNTQWPIINMLGESLEGYLGILTRRT